MPFCPFFSTQCPETYEGDEGCAIWTHFGCCIIDKPGIPATYDGADCFILSISKAAMPPPLDKTIIVFARADTGLIEESDDITKFSVHLIHDPNHR